MAFKQKVCNRMPISNKYSSTLIKNKSNDKQMKEFVRPVSCFCPPHGSALDI